MTEDSPGERALVLLARIGVRLGERDRAAARLLSLTAPQLRVLRLLLDGSCSTPAELARRLGLTPSTLTGIVDRLERAGHLSRSRTDTDRRKVTLALTNQGLELASSLPASTAALEGGRLDAQLGAQAATLESLLADVDALLCEPAQGS